MAVIGLASHKLSKTLDFLKYTVRKYRLSISSPDSIYLACSRSLQTLPEYYQKNSEAEFAEEERSKLDYLNVNQEELAQCLTIAKSVRRRPSQPAHFPLTNSLTASFAAQTKRALVPSSKASAVFSARSKLYEIASLPPWVRRTGPVRFCGRGFFMSIAFPVFLVERLAEFSGKIVLCAEFGFSVVRRPVTD